jgi:ADP-heptose:LPS heptosyltransferase
MNVLIVKTGATGDIVRTTPLLSRRKGHITWLTDGKNTVLLEGLNSNLRCVSWEERVRALDMQYDLVINLEDTLDVAQFLKTVRCSQLFGAYLDYWDTRRSRGSGLTLASLVLTEGRRQTDSSFRIAALIRT